MLSVLSNALNVLAILLHKLFNLVIFLLDDLLCFGKTALQQGVFIADCFTLSSQLFYMSGCGR
jgi:hypothetical protein